ncbi:glycosyltransferase family 2 protein [Arthrobacter oryzae]|uniref:glycosyltransferase family 2 protein n=1 Tax=Arthrobacter oryzae TaxID=409290 RepID=UPI0027D91371|nr:glycosyltransferase [Arthrobacter oryzae]
MACHNRRVSTLRCIQSAHEAAEKAGVALHITLYDDGSTDSTAESVSVQFPGTEILAGTGSEFWAKSMAIAESHVLKRIRRDNKDNSYVVWLNDDVTLDLDAFERLHKLALDYPRSILVGAMRDPRSSEVTYSALKRGGLHPLSFELCPLSSKPEPVEIFNGNLVLVPAVAAESIGGIDGAYSHAFADIDYGFRARSKSISVKLAPGSYGTCERNPVPPTRSITEDWKQFVGPKGAGNAKSMRKILQLATPRSWFVYYFASYGLWWARRIRLGLLRLFTARRSESTAK